MESKMQKDLFVINGKNCNGCGDWKVFERFSKGKYSFQGHIACCKDCINEKRRIKALNPEFKLKEKERALKRSYNLTLKRFFELKMIQGNRCGSCGKEFTDENGANVDHDHITLMIRGILCHKCNSGLGFIGDTIESVRALLKYLLWHENHVQDSIKYGFEIDKVPKP